jgi:hypothetical protein
MRISSKVTLQLKRLTHLTAHSTWYGEPEYYVKAILKDQLHEIHGTIRSRLCLRVNHDGLPFSTPGSCPNCVALTKDGHFVRLATMPPPKDPSNVNLSALTRAELELEAHRSKQHIRNVQKQLATAMQSPEIKGALARALTNACAEINPEVGEVLVSLLKAVQTGKVDSNKHGVLISVLRQAVFNLHAKGAKGLRHRKHKQAMMMYEVLLIKGGPWLASFVAANLLGPLAKATIQKQWKCTVPYSFGLDGAAKIMPQLAGMYKDLMQKLGIAPGTVPCEYSEDETNVIAAVVWDENTDELRNFCGTKGTCTTRKCKGNCGQTHHQCDDSCVLKVGSFEEGYTTITEAFKTKVVGTYGRVIMINPLHADLPSCAILLCPTCNCFTHEYVRNQWNKLKPLHDKHMKRVVGVWFGSASDGDARRRLLQKMDMTNPEGMRWGPLYLRGWALTGLLHEDGTVTCIHGQDFIHCIKKLINPTDSGTRSLLLGNYLVTLTHIELLRVIDNVAGCGPLGKHGVQHKDATRKDRQNWSSAQRVCRRRALNALKAIDEASRERTLGTYYYMRMVWQFVHIYYSRKATLRKRIYYASYVMHFLARWRAWIIHHRPNMNVSMDKCCISSQAHTDAIIACSQVILVILYFREFSRNIPVCLRKLGSDCCEHLFSEMGSWNVNKRNYTASEMATNGTKMTRLATLRANPDGPHWGRAQSHKCVWGKERGSDESDSEPENSDDEEAAPSKKEERAKFDKVMSDYESIESTDVIKQLWKSGDDDACAHLELLGMKPTAATHKGSHTWWGSLACKLLPRLNTKNKTGVPPAAATADAAATARLAQMLGDNTDGSASDSEEEDQPSENSDDSDNEEDGDTQRKFVKVHAQCTFNDLAATIGIAPAALLRHVRGSETSRGYGGFFANVGGTHKIDPGTDVPVPPDTDLPLPTWTPLPTGSSTNTVYISHLAAEAAARAEAEEDDADGDYNPDNPASSDSHGQSSSSDGEADEAPDDDDEDRAEAEREAGASEKNTKTHVELPDKSSVHRQTVVATHNANPTLSTERLYRVMKGGRNTCTLPNDEDQTAENDPSNISIFGAVAFKHTVAGVESTRLGILQKMVRHRMTTPEDGRRAKTTRTKYTRPVDITANLSGLQLTCSLLDRTNPNSNRGPMHMRLASEVPVVVCITKATMKVRFTQEDGGAFIINDEDTVKLRRTHGM